VCLVANNNTSTIASNLYKKSNGIEHAGSSMPNISPTSTERNAPVQDRNPSMPECLPQCGNFTLPSGLAATVESSSKTSLSVGKLLHGLWLCTVEG